MGQPAGPGGGSAPAVSVGGSTAGGDDAEVAAAFLDNCGRLSAVQLFALIAKRSPLCAELKRIVESVTSAGRVSALVSQKLLKLTQL